MSDHEIIRTESAPGAIGPYSQAVALPLGDKTIIYCSGQVAIDPATGDLTGGSAAEQAHRVMQSVTGLLEAAGSSLDRVIKTTIFLSSMDDFGAVNEAYGSYFDAAPPARSTVEVSRLPKDVDVEIEVIAYR